MNVRRQNVMRFTSVEFPGTGQIGVAEGVDFLADCGCRVTYGVRLDNREKCQLTFPCDYHSGDILIRALLQAGQPESEDYDTPTEELLAKVLS